MMSPSVVSTSLLMCPRAFMDVSLTFVIWHNQWHPRPGWETSRSRLVTTGGTVGWVPTCLVQPKRSYRPTYWRIRIPSGKLKRGPQKDRHYDISKWRKDDNLKMHLQEDQTKEAWKSTKARWKPFWRRVQHRTLWSQEGGLLGDGPQSPEVPSANLSGSHQISSAVSYQEASCKPAKSGAPIQRNS